MPIPLACTCGKSLKVKDDLAGKKVRCPACKGVLTVPAAVAVAEEEPMDVLPADKEENPVVKVQAEPPPMRPVFSMEDTPRPRKRTQSTSSGSGINGTAVAGGVLMMAIAVIWFVAGLFADIIFFYPPIMLVLGLIAVIKGLMGSKD